MGYCNAYFSCPSTGKAAVAIGGTTIQKAFKITIARPMHIGNGDILDEKKLAMIRFCTKEVTVHHEQKVVKYNKAA